MLKITTAKDFNGIAPESIVPKSERKHIERMFADEIKAGKVIITDIDDEIASAPPAKKAPVAASAPPAKAPIVAQVIASINAATTVEEVIEALNGDERPTAVAAANQKKIELGAQAQ